MIQMTHYPYPNFEAPQTCNGACGQDPAYPDNRWDDLGYHPDHKRVGWHVLNTCYGSGSAADNDILFDELHEAAQLQKWKVSELYFFALTRTQPITHYVPLSVGHLQTKADALAYHRSQYPMPPVDSISWTGSVVAKEAGLAEENTYAEGFQGFF